MKIETIGTIDQTDQPKKEWKLIPVGTYTAALMKLEERESKAGNPMIVADFEVDVHGIAMKHTEYFMLGGVSAKCVEITNKKLSRMAKCLGLQTPLEDTDQLKGLVGSKCTVDIEKKAGKPPFLENNKIKSFKTV